MKEIIAGKCYNINLAASDNFAVIFTIVNKNGTKLACVCGQINELDAGTYNFKFRAPASGFFKPDYNYGEEFVTSLNLMEVERCR